MSLSVYLSLYLLLSLFVSESLMCVPLFYIIPCPLWLALFSHSSVIPPSFLLSRSYHIKQSSQLYAIIAIHHFSLSLSISLSHTLTLSLFLWHSVSLTLSPSLPLTLYLSLSSSDTLSHTLSLKLSFSFTLSLLLFSIIIPVRNQCIRPCSLRLQEIVMHHCCSCRVHIWGEVI